MFHTITTCDLNWVLGEQNLGPHELYFADALKKIGRSVNYINIHLLYPAYRKKFSGYSHRFPRKIDNSVQNNYCRLINDQLIKLYKTEKPNCIFIYNDCRVLPATLDYFKKNGTKIIIFLGDDPNYLFNSKKTFLLTVMKADSVIVPDTGWIEGLKMLDLKNIIFSPIGTNPEIFHPVETSDEQKKKYGSEIIFIGTGYYLNSWGIKRAALLNELSGMNLKIFGDRQWEDLFPFFPDLKKHFINEPLSSKEVNAACCCSEIYPVTVNSGVVNGVSTRVFDCISSGIFVIAEYKKDIDQLFPGNEVVCFRSKSELKKKVLYYLGNKSEMKDHIQRSAETVRKKYTLEILVRGILEQI